MYPCLLSQRIQFECCDMYVVIPILYMNKSNLDGGHFENDKYGNYK